MLPTIPYLFRNVDTPLAPPCPFPLLQYPRMQLEFNLKPLSSSALACLEHRLSTIAVMGHMCNHWDLALVITKQIDLGCACQPGESWVILRDSFLSFISKLSLNIQPCCTAIPLVGVMWHIKWLRRLILAWQLRNFFWELNSEDKKEPYSLSWALMDGAEVGNLLTLNGSPGSISPGWHS